MAREDGIFSSDIEVDLRGVGRRVFQTASELNHWAKKESEFWREFDSRIGRTSLISGLNIGDIFSTIDKIESYSRQFLSENDAAQKQNLENNIRNYFGNYNKIPYVLASEAPDVQLLDKLVDENADAAWIGYAEARCAEITPGNVNDVIRFQKAWEVWREKGFDPEAASQAQKAALEDLHSRWDAKHRGTEESAIEIRKQQVRWARRLRRASISLLRSYKEQSQDHAERMRKIEREFSTEMTLRASEKFWSHKRKLNRERAGGAFHKLVWSGGLGLVVLSAMYAVLYCTIGLPQNLSIAHSVIYMVPTVLFVWLLRIFAGEFKSNQKMADDAEEREVMVITFKALEHEGRIGLEERMVILSALFRPHEGGADETIPLQVWETVVKGGGDKQ